MCDSCYFSAWAYWEYVKTTRFDWWNKVDQKSRLTFVFPKWVHIRVCSTWVMLCVRSYYGYQNLSRQYLRTCMLSRVFQQVHWSKTASLFAQFLPSLSAKNSSNQRNSRHYFMPRVSAKLHYPWKRWSQHFADKLSPEQFAGCFARHRVQNEWC